MRNSVHHLPDSRICSNSHTILLDLHAQSIKMNTYEEIIFKFNSLNTCLLDLCARYEQELEKQIFAQKLTQKLKELEDERSRKDLRCNLCRRQNRGSLRSTNT